MMDQDIYANINQIWLLVWNEEQRIKARLIVLLLAKFDE